MPIKLAGSVRPGRGAAKSQPRRILLIDANPESHALVRHLIGIAVPEARLVVHDAAGGLPGDDLRLDRFDLIFLDLSADEDARLRWLDMLPKGEAGAPPVLALTSIEDPDLDRRAISQGAIETLCRREMTVNAFAERIRAVWSRSTQVVVESVLTKAALMDRHRGYSKDDGSDLPARISQLIEEAHEQTKGLPTVPGYQVLREVGRGGMAIALLARRVEDDEQVILKVLQVDEGDSAVVLRRFLREFRIAARLEHPNMVKIYERAFASDFAYIAMEYCSGGDLSRKIKAGIEIPTAIDYARKIASALGVAHLAGVIHRDVKPANVLFREDGSLALTDFGIAKAKEAAVSLTLTNALVGTPYYISPELIKGVEVDHRSDLYSLG
ncbi:MAG: DNA-binding NarL/FixJ family response regulator, partial [Rhodothermales bacterium]